MALPGVISYCKITGLFLEATADTSGDPDDLPQGNPLVGATVTFRAAPSAIRTSSPAATTIPREFVCQTDASGYLYSPGVTLGEDGNAPTDKRFLYIMASNDPDIEPHDWSWYFKVYRDDLPSITGSFIATADGEIDLATVVQVPASPGVETAAWIQAVTDTQAARDDLLAATSPTPVAGKIPLYGTGGTAPVGDGVAAGDAVNLGQMGAAIDGLSSTYVAKAGLATTVTDAVSSLRSVTLIDKSASSTSNLSTTSRRFIKDIVPGKAHIGDISFRTSATAGTVTIEVWEFSGTTGNLTVAKSVAYTNDGVAGVKTVTINYDVVRSAYISFRNTASIVGYSPGEGLYIADVASTTLALSNVVSATNAQVAATVVYTLPRNPLATALAVKGSIVSVGPDGDYQTIQAACDSAPAGSTILIYPGVYREQVAVNGKEVHLLGVDKRATILIDSSSDYRTPPLRMNLGSVRNMTIIEDAASPAAGLDSVSFEGHPVKNMAYCIHADSGTRIDGSTVDQYLDIEDCILINANRPCVGMGMYVKHHVGIRNVEMHSGLGVVAGYQRGALYFHNNSTNGTLGQTLTVEGCRIYSDDPYSIYALDTGATGGTCSVELINNMAYSTVNGKAAGSVFNQLGAGATFLLAATSYGNNVASLNAA